MRLVIQRVSHASVTINGVCKSAIKEGFMILVGIEEADTKEDADWLCKKVIGLRVFDDENGVMNKSIMDINGANSLLWLLQKKGTDRRTSELPDMRPLSHSMNTSAAK